MATSCHSHVALAEQTADEHKRRLMTHHSTQAWLRARTRGWIRECRARRLCIGGLFIALTVAIGVAFILTHVVDWRDPFAGTSNSDGREEVDCGGGDKRQNRVAILAFGQSNSANFGLPGSLDLWNNTQNLSIDNFNFFDGKCYRARPPLLGPDGPWGSVWPYVGEGLITGGRADSVLIVPIGYGGSTVADWTPSGLLHVRLTRTLALLAMQDITITHVLWHQGESDCISDTAPARYTEDLSRLVLALRGYGVHAPIFVAIATYCGGFQSEPLRAAQRSLPALLRGVYNGPNTDTIVNTDDEGPALRAKDDCHFTNPAGLLAHAELWLRALEGF